MKLPVNRADPGTVKLPVKPIVPVRMSLKLFPMLTSVESVSRPSKTEPGQRHRNANRTEPEKAGPVGAEKAEKPAVTLRPSKVPPEYPLPRTVTLWALAGRAFQSRRQITTRPNVERRR